MAEMLADGLTKALTADKFRRFRGLVGLIDIKERIEARQLKEITEEDLFTLEDSFEGGEGHVVG